MSSIANPEKVALVTQIDRGDKRIHTWRGCSARWRSSRPGYVALAAAHPPARARRPAAAPTRGCRASASSPPRSASAARPPAPPTRRCATTGFLVSRRGAGSWTSLPADRPRPGSPARGPEPPARPTLDRSQLRRRRGAGGCAAPRAGGRHRRAPAPPAGPRLRRARPAGAARRDRRHISARRGLPTAPDQVLVTAGAQHAFALLLRVLAGPGDRVLVEHPTYPNALDAVRAVGGRPVPVALLAGRLGPRHARGDAAPGGAPARLPDPRPPQPDRPARFRRRARAELVALARATRTPLVVDETLAELGLEPGAARPRPGRRARPRRDTVITVGSMSKAFWAGLRIGWIRASPTLVQRLALARATRRPARAPSSSSSSPSRCSPTATRCSHGHRAALRARRDALAGALRATLPEWRFALPARRALALGRARRAAQQRARGRRRPPRRARGRRPALRGRRRLRALPAPAVLPARADARRGGRAPRRRLARDRGRRRRGGPRPSRRRSSPDPRQSSATRPGSANTRRRASADAPRTAASAPSSEMTTRGASHSAASTRAASSSSQRRAAATARASRSSRRRRRRAG